VFDNSATIDKRSVWLHCDQHRKRVAKRVFIVHHLTADQPGDAQGSPATIALPASCYRGKRPMEDKPRQKIENYVPDGQFLLTAYGLLGI
jgi:hypothetical protein